MCYSVSSNISDAEIHQLEHDFVCKWEEEERGEYYVANGFSHPKLPVITAEHKFKNYRWGLIPSWVKDWEGAKKSRVQCLNSIGEEADGKSSFRDAIKHGQFCIIPVNGFYEWHHFNDVKYPHFIYPKDKSVFLLAGLYNQWTNKAIDEVHDTFTIMTTRANERMEWIHNSKKRMPAILSLNDAKAWLDTGISYEQKKKLIEPFDPNLMVDHPISKQITNRKENPNNPKVMEPFEYPELAFS
jgi:putative SOS response-associated peptidase YedK